MTEKEKREIELYSSCFVYEEMYKSFKKKLSKKNYPCQKGYTALECFATDLENFYWVTTERIKRSEALGITYNKEELVDRLKEYTDRFLKFYKQEENIDKKVLNKLKNYGYIKTLIY